MSVPLWLKLTREAEKAYHDRDFKQAVAHINSIDIAVLPTMETLERLPYHVLSILLCQLPSLDEVWLLELINPALLKWLANQNSDTSAGVPYLARHISNLYWSDTVKYEAYRSIVQAAIQLFSFDGRINTAEATIVCQTSLEKNRRSVYEFLDQNFQCLSLSQSNFIFAFTNKICIDWVIENRSELIFKVKDSAIYYNLLAAILSYCPEADAEMAIINSRCLVSTDCSITDTFERIDSARKSARKSRTINSRLSVALCVVGQLRGYRKAFPTWGALGLSNHNVEIFVDVWDEVGRKVPVSDHASRSFAPRLASAFTRYVAEVGAEEFWRRYPTLLSLYTDPDKVSIDVISEFYNSSNVYVEADTGGFSSNSERMYYKNSVCFEKVREFGGRFDLVIKIRPDKAIGEVSTALDLTQILRECHNDKIIYVDRPNFMLATGGYSVGDQIAVGTQDDMEEYCAVWQRYRSTRSHEKMPLNYGMPVELYPHTNIAHNCLDRGILFRDLNTLGLIAGDLLEPGQIDESTIRAAVLNDLPVDPTERDLELMDATADSRASG